ncbi:MAG TPA: cysteine hydrolase [Anaerolineae bacterium]|nr:cysteine hydrolase [Anaerolineae bacterium]
MDPKETAVVLIEFQNEFCSPDGALYGAVKEVLERNNTIPNTVDLVEKARAKGVQIVYVPISFTEDYHELMDEPYGILKAVKDGKTFRKGTKAVEIIEELTPQPGDLVVEGKRGLCGFATTNLDFILRQRGIRNVALAGFLTNVCVESTMRTAYEKGYNVITLTDCTAATSWEIQEFTVKTNYPVYSRPMTHDEFLAELEG